MMQNSTNDSDQIMPVKMLTPATAAARQTQAQRQAMRQRLIRYWDLRQEQAQQKVCNQISKRVLEKRLF